MSIQSGYLTLTLKLPKSSKTQQNGHVIEQSLIWNTLQLVAKREQMPDRTMKYDWMQICFHSKKKLHQTGTKTSKSLVTWHNKQREVLSEDLSFYEWDHIKIVVHQYFLFFYSFNIDKT